MKDTKAVLSEREATYGDFSDNALLAQHIKLALHNSGNWDTLESYQAEALDMIVSKISRMMTGSVSHVDNWVDIAGYATLVVERMSMPRPKPKARTKAHRRDPDVPEARSPFEGHDCNG